MLELLEGTARAQPATLAHLKALLAVPEELPALLAAQWRLALAKALQPRLGGAEQIPRRSPATWTSHDVMEVITTESGVLGERASYKDIRVWQDEKREDDSADLQAVLGSVRSPEARAAVQANLDALDQLQ